MEIKAVITGDIVGSSQIKPEHRIDLLFCLKLMEDELQCVSPFRMELYRGDSFQLLVESPHKAMKIAILLRAGLISHTPTKEGDIWDARISVGLGTVDFISDKIVTSDGEAFMLSGTQLDTIGKRRLVVKTPWEDVNKELEISTAFVDDILSGWSSTQAGMMYMSLRQDKPKKDVAEMTGTSVQNVRNVLGNAKEGLVLKYLSRNSELLEHYLKLK